MLELTVHTPSYEAQREFDNDLGTLAEIILEALQILRELQRKRRTIASLNIMAYAQGNTYQGWGINCIVGQ